MFPELEGQVGKGKKYATAQEAYLDNKEMVDARLEEGDTSKDFMADLLTGYRKNTDTDAGAISAYNVGLGGLKNIKKIMKVSLICLKTKNLLMKLRMF